MIDRPAIGATNVPRAIKLPASVSFRLRDPALAAHFTYNKMLSSSSHPPAESSCQEWSVLLPLTAWALAPEHTSAQIEDFRRQTLWRWRCTLSYPCQEHNASRIDDNLAQFKPVLVERPCRRLEIMRSILEY